MRPGRGRGRDDSREHAAGRHGAVPGAAADAPGDPAAAGERVSPGLGGPVGGLAAPGAVAGGPLCSRTLARGASVGRSDLRAAAGPAGSRLRRRERAGGGIWSKNNAYQYLMKNLPLKALPWPRPVPAKHHTTGSPKATMTRVVS